MYAHRCTHGGPPRPHLIVQCGVVGRGILYGCPVRGFGPVMGGIFGSGGAGMLEFVEGCLYVAWHRYVDVALGVVSLDMQATV
jgi:hypothetical protein